MFEHSVTRLGREKKNSLSVISGAAQLHRTNKKMALPFAVPRSLAPGFTMARCTPRDIPQMVSVYIAAFTATRYTYWWSSVETMRRWNEARFRLRFRDPTDHQFKVVDNSNGRIVGFARWRVPEGMKGLAQGFQTYNEVAEDEYDGLESQWMHDPPKGSNEAQYHEFFTAIRGAGQRWDAKNKLGKQAYHVSVPMGVLFWVRRYSRSKHRRLSHRAWPTRENGVDPDH